MYLVKLIESILLIMSTVPFLKGDAACSEVLEVGDVCAGDFGCLGTAAVGEEGYPVVEGECVGDGCTDAVWVLGSGDEEVIGSNAL